MNEKQMVARLISLLENLDALEKLSKKYEIRETKDGLKVLFPLKTRLKGKKYQKGKADDPPTSLNSPE